MIMMMIIMIIMIMVAIYREHPDTETAVGCNLESKLIYNLSYADRNRSKLLWEITFNI